MPFLGEQQLLVIDECADNCIDLLGRYRRNEGEAYIDHIHTLRVSAIMLDHRAHHRLVERNGGEADFFASQILGRLQAAALRHHQMVKRMPYNGSN
ncbi:hypothetical protein D3C79_815730 [compost metagenome]